MTDPVDPAGHKLLIPFIDMFNHRGGTKHYLTGRTDGMLRVVAGTNVQAGEQIFIQYGTKQTSNAEFAGHYGFVDPSAEEVRQDVTRDSALIRCTQRAFVCDACAIAALVQCRTRRMRPSRDCPPQADRMLVRANEGMVSALHHTTLEEDAAHLEQLDADGGPYQVRSSSSSASTARPRLCSWRPRSRALGSTHARIVSGAAGYSIADGPQARGD